ncbi:MAG: hypothetical protein AMJ69_08415 [Gammaproteobacteria bacterium SG8_47]|nr:MAG: hypothetical protein AMJ69_08415 [Gammaproteobacteria bacterium SG8_47]
MYKLYEAADLHEAQLVLDLLTRHDIAARLLNTYAHGALGELPFTHAYPEIWLVNEADVSQARTLVYAFEHRSATQEQWRCSHCGEANPDSFELCWHCGTTPPSS